MIGRGHSDGWKRCPSRIDPVELERLRNAVAIARPKDPTITLERALSRGAELAALELEAAFNDGRPAPARTGDLPSGRLPTKRRPPKQNP